MNSSIYKFRGKWIFDAVIISIYFLTVFILITRFEEIDIKGHNRLLIAYLEAGYFPIPPGYYFLIYVFDLLIRIKYEFVASSAIVLTFFFWWKYRLVLSAFRQNIPSITPGFNFIVTLSFLFLSPIYFPLIDGEFWYLGKFTPTIWHSSTLVCVFPFCILLTLRTLKWVEKGEWVGLIILFLYGLVILLIKPNFIFCYIPALPLFVYFKELKFSKKFWGSVSLSLLLFLIILVEKYLIFTWDPVQDILYIQEEKSQVVINPFKVWFKLSREPIFDFVSSFPLLMVFLAFWNRKAFKSPMFTFSLVLLFFALLVFFLMAETGFREFHGNFYWQIPIALFLCNLSIVYTVLNEFFAKKKQMNVKYMVMICIYSLQALLGLAFWFRMLTSFTHK